MRNMGMLISIALVGIMPTVASAEMWTAQTAFEEEKSTPRETRPCGRVPVRYTLELTGNTFTATSQYGKMFNITVPADGKIDKTYIRAVDDKRRGNSYWGHLEMTGNVKSKELEIRMGSGGWRCQYQLISD